MASGSYEMNNVERDPDPEINNVQETKETPHQTVVEEDDEADRKRERFSRHAISPRWPLIVLSIGAVLYYLVYLQDYNLPTPISAEKADTKPGLLFSGERSRESLRRLTGLGPRVVGDIANEKYTPEIIEEEVKEARDRAHFTQSILIDRQKGSGAYNLEFEPLMTNVYGNVQNVLVLLKGSEDDHNILVNCHFDSLPELDGASDDAISCAVMLELIRVLSAAPKRLKHNVLFLFNGAEETPLLGSHLYFQHEWSNKSRILLNLEAAGLGGRSILFQSGPENSWLFNYYAKYAPHPHALTVGEELFQNGFIPSDTDFRIFRDFGNLPGLDFAFCRNGYVYHTKYDTEKYIPVGSHQHMGDNTLALLNSLGNAPEINNVTAYAKGQVVFYDYLGMFLISYSFTASIFLNIFATLLGIFSIVVFLGRLLRWSWLPQSTDIKGKKFEKFDFTTIARRMNPMKKSEEDGKGQIIYVEGAEENQQSEILRQGTVAVLIEFTIAVAARIAGQVAAMAVGAAISALVDAIAPLAMPWYSNVWLIFPLYWLPCAAACSFVPYLIDCWREEKRGLSLATTTQMNLVASQVPFILIFFIMTCSGSRSSSVFFIPVLMSAIANLVVHLTPIYRTVHKWIWVYLAIQIPSLLFTFYMMLIGYMFLIPVMARSGTINSDVYIGFVSSLLCIYVTNYVMPLMNLVKKHSVIVGFLMAFSLSMIIISLSTAVGFPYRAGPNDPALQRYWIMHSDREFYNESGLLRRRETGYFVLNLDRNSPRTLPLKGRNISSLRQDCQDELYCGLPLYMTRMVPLSSGSSWIPANPPNQPYTTKLELKGRCNSTPASSSRCDLELALKGPDRMTLTFAPREGAKLISWSLPTEPRPSGEWKRRPSYYIHIVRGEITGDYNITLSFEVTSQQKSGQPFIDIGLAGNHVHFEKSRTKQFQEFLDSFPDWTMTTGWISAYKGHVF